MKNLIKNAETASSACECYVNTAEIMQGRWQEDPSECLRNCKVQFLRTMANGWQENEGWVEGCGSLEQGVPVQAFWSLYWCDSTFCGVGINQEGGLGQDPTVDLIINTCQNIGFYHIIDPGPPPPNFRCSTEADAPNLCSATTAETPPKVTQGRQPDAEPPIPTNTASRTVMNTQAVATPDVGASQPAPATPAATHGSAPPPEASTTSGSSLTGQGKAAIAICSVLALILLIAFALVCLRRRKRRKASFHRALRSRRGLLPDGAPAGSPTPLISPTSSASGTRAVLTPPLRLRDRKFLPSILRPGSRSQSPPLTPLTPAYSPQPGAGAGGIFPPSPICSPTTSKLVPRHERRAGHTATTSSAPRTFTSYPPPLSFTTATTPRNPPNATHLPEPPFFTLPTPIPIPLRGSPASTNPWPPPYSPPHAPFGGTGGTSDSKTACIDRGSGSASSCYTAGTAASSTTAHSSLRHHEIPIAIPFYMGAAVGGRGREGEGGERGTPPLLLPNRPPRPHEGMLEVPGLVTPAAVGDRGGGGGGEGGCVGGQNWERGYENYSYGQGYGYGYAVGSSGKGAAEGGRAGSVDTPPPPPPPLSPPPTRALPKTPPASMSTPTPPLVLPARGPARGSPAPGSVSPPPGYSGGDGKGSQPGLLGPRGRDHLAPPAGPETGSPYRHEHGRLVGYSPAEQTSDGARGGPRRQQDPRESWGSWSGAGTVVGSGSYHASSVNNVNVTAESATPAGEREGISSGTRGQHVSPRTSVSSDVTATADTMVTAVSRMSSARDDK